MWFVLALLSAFFNGFSTFFFKVNTMKKGTSVGLLWGFFLSGALSCILFLFFQSSFNYHVWIFVAGVVIGAAVSIGNYLYSRLVNLGPAGLATMIAHSHVILVVFMSLIIYGEKIAWKEIVGVILLIAGVILLPFDPNQERRIKHAIWYLFVGITFVMYFIRSAGLKVTQELQFDNSMVLLISYVFGFIWYSFQILLMENLEKKERHWIGIACGIVSGILSFAAYQTFASALTVGPASLISPIMSSNGVIVVLLSYWVYKERLSIFQIFSIGMLLLGIVLMRI